METTLHLLRHGSIEGCEVRRFRGQMDVPLDENGRRQAAWWRERLGAGRFSKVYASDLSRTMETARIVTGGESPIMETPALREIALGAWEGRTPEEVMRDEPEAYRARGADIAGYRTPGGESFEDVRKRAWAAFTRIADAAEGEVLIVCHGGVIRTILCGILDVPLPNLFRIILDYAGLSVVVRKGGGLALAAMNLTPPRE